MFETIISILLLGGIFFILVGIVSTRFARRLAPNRYEWLLVINHHEWKRTPTIIEDLLKLKKAKYRLGLRLIIYNDLMFLEEENLIETREVLDRPEHLPLTEYKLTIKGVRKKNEMNASKTCGLPKNVSPI